MSAKQILTAVLVVAALIIPGCARQEPAPPPATATAESISTATATTEPTPEPTATAKPDQVLELRKRVSQEKLFGYIEDLTSVQAYSGWRHSASEGEAEALDYVAGKLGEMAYLQSLGLELERQSFRVYLATEIWESRLFLTVDGEESEVPANAISGHREVVGEALRFDSDGALNDGERDPVEVSGEALVLRSAEEARNLEQDEVQGKIALLHFEAIDPAAGSEVDGAGLITALIEKGAAGLVLVTESGHGKYAGDGTILEGMRTDKAVPLIYARMEDLAPAGVGSWEELAQIEAARLVWDTDVFSPGESGNLVARIPGADPTRAVILGAHIDSNNSPGAGDNALNDAVLLELARILDEAMFQPPVDIYLAWFGSEEIGFYGAQHFVNTHQEVLDRTLGATVFDGYTADKPGPTVLAMQASSHARFGDMQLPFTDYLSEKAEAYGIALEPALDYPIFASDDGPFYGFVASARMAYGSNRIGKTFHSPYDTLEGIQDQGDVMEQSVAMALVAAIGTPVEAPETRVTPEAQRRAVIVTTHTEALHMSPSLLINLDRALTWEGFDVDVIPYGQALRADDLAEAGLVLVLPVVDYPTTNDDPSLYDEAWEAEEIELLVEYVQGGGLLVLTNSANLLFFGESADINEDWEKMDALGAPFGIGYESPPFKMSLASFTGEHPLGENLPGLRVLPENGLPIRLEAGEVLAELEGQPALALVEYGEAGGQVLVLTDLGCLDLFDFGRRERDNFSFLRNLARFARGR